jgi:hypothetical protein
VTCADTITSSAWAAIGIELRTANPADPLLVQALGTANNESSNPLSGATFSLPQAALAGNAIVCGLTYPYSSSRTVSITDNESNTWSSAVSVSTSYTTVALWYAPNVAAGTLTITIAFDTTLNWMQFACKEAYNIVASSPLDGTASVASATTSSVATGSITTTANNDLIFMYGNFTGGGLSDYTNFVNFIAAGPGWSPIIADTITGEFFGDIQQSAAGSITPSYDVEIISGYSNAWGAVAAAFKTSTSQGTAPPSSGIHIDHIMSETIQGGTYTFQMPLDGNFLAVPNTYGATIVDSMQNSYSQNGPTGAQAQAYLDYATNPTVRLAQLFTVTVPDSVDNDLVWMDIRGAATTSPIDTSAFNEANQPSMAAGYQWSGMPTITPSAINELVIADLPTGCGPAEDASAPSGAITDSVWYSGMTDSSNFNQACGHAHYLATSTAQESWTWVMQNTSCAGNYSESGAWAIKAQPTARSVTPAHASIF